MQFETMWPSLWQKKHCFSTFKVHGVFIIPEGTFGLQPAVVHKQQTQQINKYNNEMNTNLTLEHNEDALH